MVLPVPGVPVSKNCYAKEPRPPSMASRRGIRWRSAIETFVVYPERGDGQNADAVSPMKNGNSLVPCSARGLDHAQVARGD